MHIDRDGGDILMVAGGTGLAPLRTLIMDLTRKAVNPRVHLFFGARYPCELYDLRTLWQVAVAEPVAVGDTGIGVQHGPPVGDRLPRRGAATRPARPPDRDTAGGRHAVRQLG